MQFSLPYIDQPPDFWESLAGEFTANIWEVYFPIQHHILPTGRPMQLSQHLASFLEKSILPKAVLLNPIIFPKPFEELKDLIINELYLLHKQYGIKKATVSNLLLCKYIKQELPYYEVSGSILMRINDIAQIDYLDNCVDSITLDTSIIRNLNRMKALRKCFTKTIKLLVNEGCLLYCPFRVQHFYEMSMEEISFPQSLCQDLLQDKPWLGLESAWILPQHLYFYEGLYDIIKLAGRVTLQAPEKYRRVFNAYLSNKELSPHEIGCGPGGCREDITITADFFYKTITCDKNCSQCQTCRLYYEKHVKR